MKYIIKVKSIEEYEVEADSKEEAIKIYSECEPDINSKLTIISREHKFNIEEKPVDTVNGLYHIPDGTDYNYTGYRPFSNRDYERMQGTNTAYRTDGSVFSIRK
jgi:hypothetical protein